MFAPYLMWIKIAILVLVFGAGWTVNGWRHDAAGRHADNVASDRRIEKTDEVRKTEQSDAKASNEVDKNHGTASTQVAAEAQQNTSLSAGITGAAERVRDTRNATGGNTVSGGLGTSGVAPGRSADADRADRCEALLAEGIDLGAEGGELLRGTAYSHDNAAIYAAAGHDWAVRKRHAP